MSTHMMVELVGYIGSILVLISFLMTSVVKLRIINAVGGTIFAVYAMIIQSYPTALMNFCLVGINIYYLVRLRKSDRNYDFIEGKPGESMVQYMMDFYHTDIQKYFPIFKEKQPECDTAYVVCKDASPAGLFLGKKGEKGELEVLLDYSVPAYRDCSVGNYLYSKLKDYGIRKMIFTGTPGPHESYLQTMGFEKVNGVYVKELA